MKGPGIMNEELKALRKALKSKTTDRWAEGTVIRWTSGGRYTYAAIKTAVGWYTTSGFNNGYVPKTLSYEDLIEILAKSISSDIAIATEWATL
jgi:hypothetical protein